MSAGSLLTHEDGMRLAVEMLRAIDPLATDGSTLNRLRPDNIDPAGRTCPQIVLRQHLDAVTGTRSGAMYDGFVEVLADYIAAANGGGALPAEYYDELFGASV